MSENEKIIGVRLEPELVQDKLKEFLKDLESSPQQVSFEKEVLVKFISEMIEGVKMSDTYSYSAGYHRGLNTEYHDVPIEILFKQWIEQIDILLIPVTFDPYAFELGYKQGLKDYFEESK